MVVVKMLLEQIQQYCRMWSTMDILHLMAGKLCHYRGIPINLRDDVKQRYTHIARQQHLCALKLLFCRLTQYTI